VFILRSRDAAFTLPLMFLLSFSSQLQTINRNGRSLQRKEKLVDDTVLA
jgi:hypothetical protein